MVAPRSASSAPLVGVLYMCMAAGFGLPGLNALVKALIADYHMVQIIWFRCVVHLGFMVVLFMPAMGPRLWRAAAHGLQSIRSLTPARHLHADLGRALLDADHDRHHGALHRPLILVALSVPFLGERVGPRRWAAVFVGFVGVLIVLRPGADAVHWGALLVLGGAFFYAIYQIQTRKLAGHDDPRTTAVYTILAAFIVATVAVPFFWDMPRSTVDWLLFLSLGVVGGLAHYFIIKAYQYAEASLVGPFDYSQLVGASIFGFAFFGEVPDAWTWVGAAVIIASGLYIAHREARLRRTAT